MRLPSLSALCVAGLLMVGAFVAGRHQATADLTAAHKHKRATAYCRTVSIHATVEIDKYEATLLSMTRCRNGLVILTNLP